MIIKHKNKMGQRGISLIEFTLTILISIPCIIFVQNRVVNIFDDVIAKNMIYSFYSVANYIGEKVQNRESSYELSSENYTRVPTKELLSDKYFSFYLSDNLVRFYIRPEQNKFSDIVNGYYILGVLSPPDNLTLSKSLVYDILGSTAGYINGENIISITNSFSAINLSSNSTLKSFPKNSVFYFNYFPKNRYEQVFKPHINADAIVLNGKSLAEHDGIIDYTHCDINCMNRSILLTWREQGFGKIKIQLEVNNSIDIPPIDLPPPTSPGVYYISLLALNELLTNKYDVHFSPYNPILLNFSLFGVDVYGKTSRIPFIGKIDII